MEHLKLFATRLNIPRLIRICEELHHWRELVYLYIQYDEYDNAALVQVGPCLQLAGCSRHLRFESGNVMALTCAILVLLHHWPGCQPLVIWYCPTFHDAAEDWLQQHR